MNAQRLLTIGSSLTAATFIALWLNERQHQTTPDTDRFYAKLTTRATEQEQQQVAKIAQLSEDLHLKRAQLNETSLMLTEANNMIARLRTAMPSVPAIPNQKAKLLAEPGSNGRFKKLITPDGSVLMEDVEFSSETDGRLTFKTPKGRRAFDARQLHPQLLAELGFSQKQLLAKAQAGARRRADIRAGIERSLRLAAEDTRRLMEDKARAAQELEKERLQIQKETQERQMQYQFAQQQMQAQQERDRNAEILRQQQLQLEALRLQNQRTYLIQQQQQGIVYQTGPVVRSSQAVTSL